MENPKATGMVSMPNKNLPVIFLAIVSAFVPVAAWTPPAFSRLDSLFVTAATGEPKFQVARAAAESALLADTATLPYLLAKRLRGQTPRQQHYVERLFTVSSDSGRDPRPRALLAPALAAPQTSDTIRVQLLYIGSQLGDSSFRSAALLWLKSPYEPVRRMATRNLGVYPHPHNLPLLWKGLSTMHGLELQQRLWSLEAQGPVKDWRIIPLLNDPYFFNRRKVRDMLLKAADSSWAELQVVLKKHGARIPRKEWWLLAQDAKDGDVFLKAEKGKMTNAERTYFGTER